MNFLDIGNVRNAHILSTKVRFCEKRKRWLEIVTARYGEDVLVYEKEIHVLSGENLLDRKAK